MAGSTVSKSVFPRNVLFLFVILLVSVARHRLEPPRPNFLLSSPNISGIWNEVCGFFTGSQERRDWANSLNDDDSTVRFLATGAFSRTLLVIVYPSSRVNEDFTEDEILYGSDSDEVDFRSALRARGFTDIRVNQNDPKALSEETRGQGSQATVVDSGKV